MNSYNFLLWKKIVIALKKSKIILYFKTNEIFRKVKINVILFYFYKKNSINGPYYVLYSIITI